MSHFYHMTMHTSSTILNIFHLCKCELSVADLGVVQWPRKGK